MADSLDLLVEKLRGALDEDLVSIILYGSAAVGDYCDKFSDYNVLCVLKQIGSVQLGATETIFRWWHEKGNPSPLLLTEQEMETSTDSFAMEFHDIKQNHRILYGANPISSLTIDWVFYRAQVERELRAKLLRMRQKSSGVLSDRDVLRQLMVDSISTFCVLFRHALFLHGVESPGRKREIIEKTREHFAIDSAPFNALLDQREEVRKAKDIEPRTLLTSYLTEIGKVIEAVDRLEKENHP